LGFSIFPTPFDFQILGSHFKRALRLIINVSENSNHIKKMKNLLVSLVEYQELDLVCKYFELAIVVDFELVDFGIVVFGFVDFEFVDFE
jgi:hypothetical protein